MKIRCDVCDKAEASVYCAADEAAICNLCDHQVHHANKLAEKHQRFSLLHPTSKDYPLCDICQEKRALVFCREDRAILCKVCDIQIHKANKYTQKHSRFLLTGAKLSASSSQYPVQSVSSDGSIVSNESNTKLSAQEVPGELTGANMSASCSQYSVKYVSTNGSVMSNESNTILSVQEVPGKPSFGFKLSASSSQYPVNSVASNGPVMSNENNTILSVQEVPGKPSFGVSGMPIPASVGIPEEPLMTYGVADGNLGEPSPVSTSSISEYLMETIPGWCVEDFLDFPTSSHSFCKSSESFFPNFDQESSICSLPVPVGDLSFYVPQEPKQHPQFVPQSQNGMTKEGNSVKVSRKRSDDSFYVPVISPPSLKKFRYF